MQAPHASEAFITLGKGCEDLLGSLLPAPTSCHVPLIAEWQPKQKKSLTNSSNALVTGSWVIHRLVSSYTLPDDHWPGTIQQPTLPEIRGRCVHAYQENQVSTTSSD